MGTEAGKLTYYGYLSRKNNLNLTKCKVQGKPEGKRVQGRPRVKLIKHHIGNSTNYIKIKKKVVAVDIG